MIPFDVAQVEQRGDREAPAVPRVTAEEAEAVVAFVRRGWEQMSPEAQADVIRRLERIAEGTRRPLPDPRSHD